MPKELTKAELQKKVEDQEKEIKDLKTEIPKIDVLQKQIDVLANKKKFKGSKIERVKKFKGRTATDFLLEQRLAQKKL